MNETVAIDSRRFLAEADRALRNTIVAQIEDPSTDVDRELTSTSALERLDKIADATEELAAITKLVLRNPERILEELPGPSGIDSYEAAIAALEAIHSTSNKQDSAGNANGVFGRIMMAAWRHALKRARALAPDSQAYSRDTNRILRSKRNTRGQAR